MGARRTIANGAHTTEKAEASALLFLFARGKRPNGYIVRQVIEKFTAVSISHDPSQHVGADRECSGAGQFELLCEGLTFDLVGLGEANTFAVPPLSDPDAIFDGRIDDVEAVGLAPGPHLLSGAHTLPIMRVMMALGATLAAELKELSAVAWPESGRILSPSRFTNSIDAWLKDGRISQSALISFDPTMDNAVQSQGLAYFTGQELRLEPELADEADTALRLGARLLDHLVHVGKLVIPEQFVGPDGAPLLLEPSKNGSFVRARRV